VVKGAGYAWRIERGTLEIRRFEERIYHLDYLDMTGETVIDVGGDMLASSVEESGVAGKYQIKTSRTRENTDTWTAVRETLEGIKSPDGILRMNRSAGMIYLADTPTRIASMVRFLDSLGETLRRQVFIEARILEVRLSDTHRYGIDWTRINIGFVTDSTTLADNFFVNFNRGGGIFRADSSVFETVIDFLRTQGDVSVLSKPHLSVMNGQSSLMTVGFQFPYGDVDGVDRDAQTGLVTIGTSIRRAVLGLQLGITPQIAADGIVTLHIVPTITRIQGTEQVEIPTTSTTVLKIANPVIDLQELATTVSVREGHTIVLAGLISQMKKLDTEGLPFFSKIPFLKYFFGRVENEIENRELVVLITPYIKKAL
jgi:MSHA biogenesis protein MshL